MHLCQERKSLCVPAGRGLIADMAMEKEGTHASTTASPPAATEKGGAQGEFSRRIRPSLHALWATLPFALLLWVSGASGAPFSPYDVFIPACNGTLGDPSSRQWALWSRPSTWLDGKVPGIDGRRGVNATIECGQAVILDVREVELTVLNIRGSLKFMDSPSLPSISLTAALVLVQGYLGIGSTGAPFSQKARITLAPNPNGRADFSFSEAPPADPQNPRDLGHKALAVVGGQLDLHGMWGAPDTPAWVRLGASAKQGDSSILVRGNVSAWPVGAPLVVGPTDYDFTEDDIASIVAVSPESTGLWKVSLDRGLDFNHFGDPLGVPDGFGGHIDETAEVALLSRSIVIAGTEEPAPHELEGGHFIVFMTRTQQVVDGVHFSHMGQQGRLGRYPIHFHVCGDLSGEASPVVRRNLVLQSQQRCVVVHATHNVTIDSTVAYNTSGHCFMVEEGAEFNNTFSNNLGMRTRPAAVLIPSLRDPNATEETDSSPATFWLSNPANNLVGNVAAGSDSSGFWLEFRGRPRGISRTMPTVNNTTPRFMSLVATFSGNVAHSNRFAGVRMYPPGWDPKEGGTVNSDATRNAPTRVRLGGFSLWKHPRQGLFVHQTENVDFVENSFADNTVGVTLAQVEHINVSDSRFVGRSNNYGTPSGCQDPAGVYTCAPITGCSFPLGPGEQGRSVPLRQVNQTFFGVVFEQDRSQEKGDASSLVLNCTFSAYDPACSPAAAIGAGLEKKNFWNTGHGFGELRFNTATPTNPVVIFPETFFMSAGDLYENGPVSSMIAIHDIDGSVVGVPEGGYIVANNSEILLQAPACTPLGDSFGYSCPGTCYRSIQVVHYEPAMGTPSQLQLTRLEDNTTSVFQGYPPRPATITDEYGNTETANVSLHVYSLSLPGGFTYEMQVLPGNASAGFRADWIRVVFVDGYGCGKGIALLFPGSAQDLYSWGLQDDNLAWAYAACPSNTGEASSSNNPLQLAYSCRGSLQALQVNVSASFPPAVPLTVVPIPQPPAPCSHAVRCGLVGPTSTWDFNQQGVDLQPSVADAGGGFYDPVYQGDAVAWETAPGILGSSNGLRTLLPPKRGTASTYYFQTEFNVSYAACVSSLLLETILDDGVVLYLNGMEIVRSNMPAGPISNETLPLQDLKPFNKTSKAYTYTPFSLSFSSPGQSLASLAEGMNLLAAEVHTRGSEVTFAVRASAVVDATCMGSQLELPSANQSTTSNSVGSLQNKLWGMLLIFTLLLSSAFL